MTTTPFGGKKAIVYSLPREFGFEAKSRKYFLKETWHEEITSHFHVPHVYTITVELSNERFGPFPRNIDHFKGQFPVKGKFFRLEDNFLKTLMKEVAELASQKRQSQTGCKQSPYNHSPCNHTTILSSPSLLSSTDNYSPTSSATTSTRASDNETSEKSQAQNSDTLETEEQKEIIESNSHQPKTSEVPASEQSGESSDPFSSKIANLTNISCYCGPTRSPDDSGRGESCIFSPYKLLGMSPSNDTGPGA
jgi:hypothetical protein